MSRSEAERVADRAIELRQTAAAKMDTLKQKAAETAEQAASATSTTLWLALVGMLLSLGAAVAGAKWGSGRGEVVKIA